MLVLFGSLAIAAPPAPGRAVSPTAQDVAVDGCTMQYQRADNMWAAAGRPDGSLGIETVTVPAGSDQRFDTSWYFEKRRNDGVHYYGSHLRIATNTGARQVTLRVMNQMGSQSVSLQPGQTLQFQNDLANVGCW
jgi:hypothetical protein